VTDTTLGPARATRGDEEEVPAGALIGHFVVLGTLGRGGFGTAAHVRDELGVILRVRGCPAEALELHRAAHADAEAKLGPDDEVTVFTLEHVGLALRDLGRLPEARAALEDAVRRAERRFGPDDAFVSPALTALASVSAAEGDRQGAIAEYRRALTLRGKRGKTHPELCEIYEALTRLGDPPPPAWCR
jgi:tetratricopeptide (TPR) repeat protein